VIDEEALFADLAAIGLGGWRERLAPLLEARLADAAHGHLATWRALLDELPMPKNVRLEANRPAVTLAAPDLPANDRAHLREQLRRLMPWRKGPFDVCGIAIDSEWRSDLKWDRVRHHLAPLDGRNVLDVGCGNGYYALRMLGAGAARVIGIDPTVLFVVQFLALRKLGNFTGVHVLPLRLEDLPPGARAFDTAFSMGVLYHRRDPAAHLGELHGTLCPGGELVLETLVIPGDRDEVVQPADRYARMRNVWHLPTVVALERWLAVAGFDDLRLVDVTATTPEEQRRTDWMPFESLAEALDPANPDRTVEGLPAPRRAIVLGTAR